jgi:indolepyruvate ferredoxin oxidoreductase alpha subunit
MKRRRTPKERKEQLLLGNEAIARGLLESGCSVAASYPGTPASEIISALITFKRDEGNDIYVEWSVNEKSAFEIALSNSYLGNRSAAIMKNVGLNVASDSLISASYSGIEGGFLIISADDPGPHSSQSEQDSRLLAILAKIPVFDPSSPKEAKEMIGEAFILSERYKTPVMFRPTTRVCHARQIVPYEKICSTKKQSHFTKDPSRWVSLPEFRKIQHKELNEKIDKISKIKKHFTKNSKGNYTHSPYAIFSSGVSYAYAYDTITELNLWDKIDLYQIRVSFPLDLKRIDSLITSYRKVMVLEEIYPVIEMQIGNRQMIAGRWNKYLPSEGELTPDIIYASIKKFMGYNTKKTFPPPNLKTKKPTLCAGCSHRASLFAIRCALPEALYPSDIGCYTLGINTGAIDTALCMGASVNQAAGFYHSFEHQKLKRPPIIATIGDSTFFHAGIPSLINATYNQARFILVILDNLGSAMTGNQPTVETGPLPNLRLGNPIDLKKIVKACGVSHVEEVDPYNISTFISLLKEANDYCSSEQGGVATIIAKRSCLRNEKIRTDYTHYTTTVTDKCIGCGECIKYFGCPALNFNSANKKILIDRHHCIGCGVCRYVCSKGAISVI